MAATPTCASAARFNVTAVPEQIQLPSSPAALLWCTGGAKVRLCSQFCRLSARLAFGEHSTVLREKRNATVQSLSGTGSLRARIHQNAS